MSDNLRPARWTSTWIRMNTAFLGYHTDLLCRWWQPWNRWWCRRSSTARLRYSSTIRRRPLLWRRCCSPIPLRQTISRRYLSSRARRWYRSRLRSLRHLALQCLRLPIPQPVELLQPDQRAAGAQASCLSLRGVQRLRMR